MIFLMFAKIDKKFENQKIYIETQYLISAVATTLCLARLSSLPRLSKGVPDALERSGA